MNVKIQILNNEELENISGGAFKNVSNAVVRNSIKYGSATLGGISGLLLNLCMITYPVMTLCNCLEKYTQEAGKEFKKVCISFNVSLGLSSIILGAKKGYEVGESICNCLELYDEIVNKNQ